MRFGPSLRHCAGFASALAALLLLCPSPAGAACNPGSCNGVFDCGFRECVGLTCETFFEDSGTLCRSAAGECDHAESCNGHSLACPSDTKRSSATVCRSAVDDCDGAENCDGSSNDCPADVGIVPTISRVTIVDQALRFGPIESASRFFHMGVDGANLCEGTVDSPDINLFQLAEREAPFRLGGDIAYLASSPPFGSATYSFDINRGAAAGTLNFVAGAPDGFVEILSPSTGATVDGNPVFSISNGCSNCNVVRAEVSDDVTELFVAETPADFVVPPFDTPTEIVFEDLVPASAPLPEGHYEFDVDAIDGSLFSNRNFVGDSSGVHFDYLVGTAIRNKITFVVPAPEPAPSSSALVAIAALGTWACARRQVRRGGHPAA